MRIDQRPGVGAVGAGAARKPGAGGAFSIGANARSGAAAASGAAAPMVSLDALISMQANDDATGERKRRAVKRGHSLLDALDGLKLALLSGQVWPSELLRLKARLMDERGACGDPVLDDIIAHIELRAEVEMAKLAHPRIV